MTDASGMSAPEPTQHTNDHDVSVQQDAGGKPVFNRGLSRTQTALRDVSRASLYPAGESSNSDHFRPQGSRAVFADAARNFLLSEQFRAGVQVALGKSLPATFKLNG